MLDNASNQPSNFRTKNWVETSDESRGTYFKTSMLRSSLCDYSDAVICDVVMPMYNLIEYSDTYSKTSGSLWQYWKDIPAVNNNGKIIDINGANATDTFNFKTKIIGQTDSNGRINVEIIVPLKHLRNFWRTLQMSLINCEANLILTLSADCVIIYTDVANQISTFTITETNLYSSSYFINSR